MPDATNETVREAHASAERAERAAFYARWAKERIEALATQPILWSNTAYALMNAHVTFATEDSGEGRHMGASRIAISDDGDLGDLAERLVAAVRAFADTVGAERQLIWRAEPEFTWQDGRWRCWARLSIIRPPHFQPAPEDTYGFYREMRSPLPALAAAPGTWTVENAPQWIPMCWAIAAELDRRREQGHAPTRTQDERMQAAAAIRLLLGHAAHLADELTKETQ